MFLIDDAQILSAHDPVPLIEALRAAFATANASDRIHYDLPGEDKAKLLIMPSWADRAAIGVKVITVVPSNARRGLPTIDGAYILLEGATGLPMAVLSARALTSIRTAAVSALGSSLLSRTSASTLLMVGTGALAPHLVRAHLAVRNFRRVLIWGRDSAKAKGLAHSLKDLDTEVVVVDDLRASVKQADIISCATSSTTPLIHGQDVAPGTHVDLVGSFTPEMREADSDLFRGSRLVVDTQNAIDESGDILVPLREGVLAREIPDLRTLIKGGTVGRRSETDVTIFKAVGTGLADLATARYVFEAIVGRDVSRSVSESTTKW